MDLSVDQARDVLLMHARHPANRVKVPPDREAFPYRGECRNPLCGDHVQVFLKTTRERIDDIRICVLGCTMCMASASLMSVQVKDTSRAQALNLFYLFERSLLEAEADAWPEPLQSLKPLAFLRKSKARISCALIPWYALKQACQF